ncbi:MAG: hypothetical protein ACM3XO_03020, partial [Bacteroidota bacterium]
MNLISISSVAAIVVSILVLIQGCAILLSAETRPAETVVLRGKNAAGNASSDSSSRDIPKSDRIIGLLTILLASLGILITSLYLSTDLALSPEFGIVLTRGPWATVFFYVTLLLLLLCLCLGWDLARVEAEKKSRSLLIYSSAGAVWLLCWIPDVFTKVTAGGPNEVPIYLFDIWWPPFAIWITVAFTDIALTILGVDSAITRSVAAMVMVDVVLWIALFFMPPPGFGWALTRTLWLTIPIFVLFAGIIMAIYNRRKKKTDQKIPESRTPKEVWLDLKKSFHDTPNEQLIRLAPLAGMAAGMIILLFGSRFVGPVPLVGPGLSIILLLVSWGFMTELITHGWYKSIKNRYQKKKSIANGEGGDRAARRPNRSMRLFAIYMRRIFSFPKHWTALLKFALLLALLIVVKDVLDYGKTIIQPFQAIGFDDTTTPVASSLAASSDARLIDDLLLLSEQLRPVLIFPNSSGRDSKRVDYVPAGSVSTSIDAALTGAEDVDFGFVKLPAGVLFTPVQELTRPLARIRVVNGSIVSNGNDRYALLANTSDGSAWNVKLENTPDLRQAIPDLVEELAFQMISSEDKVQNYGFTKNYQAYQYFEQGLENVDTYKSLQDYDALAAAIQSFRKAAVMDPKFALAYYHLGLALQEDRQPYLAETAFRTGVDLNPNSIPLKNALAYHLYSFNGYFPPRPAAVFETEAPNLKGKTEEARLLWQQIVSLPILQVYGADRASAYLGLCKDSLEHRGSDMNKTYLAYFYCYKAHTLIERLPRDQQSEDKLRQAEAEALNNMGTVILGRGFTKSKAIDVWLCQDPGLDRNGHDLTYMTYHPAYARAALSYYKAALVLQPRDPVIACNAAIAAWLEDQPERIAALDQSPQAHYKLGQYDLARARLASSNTLGPSPYFKKAIAEFDAALSLDPTYQAALNDYAYTYWVFQLNWHGEDPEKIKSAGKSPMARQAEDHAREALRLANINQDLHLQVLY